MTKKIDYTTWPDGKKTGYGKEKTSVCPRCGRGGVISLFTGLRGRYGLCTHAGMMIGSFFDVTDRCFISQEDLNNIE